MNVIEQDYVLNVIENFELFFRIVRRRNQLFLRTFPISSQRKWNCLCVAHQVWKLFAKRELYLTDNLCSKGISIMWVSTHICPRPFFYLLAQQWDSINQSDRAASTRSSAVREPNFTRSWLTQQLQKSLGPSSQLQNSVSATCMRHWHTHRSINPFAPNVSFVLRAVNYKSATTSPSLSVQLLFNPCVCSVWFSYS